MGHSTICVTMDVCGHLMHDAGNEATERLAALVLGGSKTVATEDAGSQEDRNLKEMEAGVGIEPAYTALQFPPGHNSQQRAAGDNNNIRHLHRGQQSAIM